MLSMLIEESYYNFLEEAASKNYKKNLKKKKEKKEKKRTKNEAVKIANENNIDKSKVKKLSKIKNNSSDKDVTAGSNPGASAIFNRSDDSIRRTAEQYLAAKELNQQKANEMAATLASLQGQKQKAKANEWKRNKEYQEALEKQMARAEAERRKQTTLRHAKERHEQRPFYQPYMTKTKRYFRTHPNAKYAAAGLGGLGAAGLGYGVYNALNGELNPDLPDTDLPDMDLSGIF